MHQQLWGYKVEWRSVSRGTGGKRLNTIGLVTILTELPQLIIIITVLVIHTSPSFVRIVKLRTLRCAEHAATIGKQERQKMQTQVM